MTFTKLRPNLFHALLPHHKVAYKIYLHQARMGLSRDKRGKHVLMRLKFFEWFFLWEESGHWDERGRTVGCYHMCRLDTQKHFETGNVVVRRIGAQPKLAVKLCGFKQLTTCDRCGKTGKLAAMKRWHFDNCIDL